MKKDIFGVGLFLKTLIECEEETNKGGKVKETEEVSSEDLREK